MTWATLSLGARLLAGAALLVETLPKIAAGTVGVLLAGFPDTVPGMTLNRFCSSGLQAVADAAKAMANNAGCFTCHSIQHKDNPVAAHFGGVGGSARGEYSPDQAIAW